MKKSLSYKEIVEKIPAASKVLPPSTYDWIMDNNEFMDDKMGDMWLENVEDNLDNLYDKCGCVGDGVLGFAFNKCVIGIGSGPSYHINSKVLADAYRLNANQKLADQPFILITTNHQFSQCLKDGIHPHFVMATDATKELRKQLGRIPTEDVKNTILLANMYCDPTALKRWVDRGGTLSFFIPENPIVIEKFQEKGNPDHASLQSAGNVMNMMWLMSLRFLHSQVFFCVGNDLSFDYTPDIQQRAKSFYADGNIAEDHERNQTKDYMAWQGFKFSKGIIDYKPQINMELRGTSRQLFQYKLWLELHALNFAESKNTKFSYFNCSEQGILGVLAHDWETESLYKRDNWFLLDEICPWYHTSKLENAISLFLRWRTCLTPMVTRTSAEPVIVLPGRMGGVGDAARSGNLIVSP